MKSDRYSRCACWIQKIWKTKTSCVKTCFV